MHRVLLTLPPCLALLLVLVGLPSPPVGADELTARSHIDARTRQAVESGLRYLKRTQNADGSWSSNAGKKINETYAVFENGADVPHVGITSLAILAYLAGGHLPGRGPYGETLDRAVDFVLDQVQPGGFIASNKTRMYSHAFATLALAELYGVTRTQLVRQKLQEAVEFTVKCQNETGGWRYVPFTKDSDMSVTVCQVVALRAARNAGIRVPRATINRALHYVITSANDGSDPRYPAGSFLYQPETQHFNRDSYALCAAGLTTMFQAGLYDDASLEKYMEEAGIRKRRALKIRTFIDYMLKQYDRVATPEYRRHYFFFYGNYYAAQAMYQVGGHDPGIWAKWFRRVHDDLLATQIKRPNPDPTRSEGWWVSNVDSTNAYATATALLILQFPLDQLPIHQR